MTEKGRNTYIWDPQEMCVKLIQIHQPPGLEYEGYDPPNVERSKEKEEEEGKSREPMGGVS